ncbi:MAG: hypothetical protein JWO44_922 [Bacteroidetes bacterium]|nr:hypothetical protein [Bacteroidota bacterium]
MTKYPFFKKIIHSFYNKDVYIHAGKVELNRIGFRYLLLLLAVFWIPEIIKVHVSILKFINVELPVFVEKLPVVEIHDGVASFDKPSPYILKDENGKDAVIFDDSGEYTSLENTEAQMLVTDSKLIYIKDKFETREYDFSKISNFSLTHEKILSWASWGNFLSIFLYLFIVPCMFLYRAVQALLYSLVGLIFQAILKTNFSYQAVYRLTILAITPAFVINKLLGYFDIDFTGWSFLCMAISLGYLFFGMKATRDANVVQPAEPGTTMPVENNPGMF